MLFSQHKIFRMVKETAIIRDNEKKAKRYRKQTIKTDDFYSPLYTFFSTSYFPFVKQEYAIAFAMLSTENNSQPVPSDY